MTYYEPCIICGVLTEWRCADCAITNIHKEHPNISKRKSVAVCHKPECRNKHEEQEREAHQFQVK